jgi:hypothetical protein
VHKPWRSHYVAYKGLKKMLKASDAKGHFQVKYRLHEELKMCDEFFIKTVSPPHPYTVLFFLLVSIATSCLMCDTSNRNVATWLRSRCNSRQRTPRRKVSGRGRGNWPVR